MSIENVIAATDYVVPALELIAARSYRTDPDSGYTRKVFDTIADNAANAAFGVSPTPAPDMSRLGAQPGRIARRNQNTVFVCWVDTFWPSPEPLCIHSEGNFAL